MAAVCLAAQVAAACSVTVREPLKYAFKSAPIAFEGTLEHIDADGSLHFAIHRQWKGAQKDKIAIRNPQTSCGYYGGRVGERYVVVPEADGSIYAGSHVEEAQTSVMARILDGRALWWKCPLSSFTVRAIVRAAAKIADSR